MKILNTILFNTSVLAVAVSSTQGAVTILTEGFETLSEGATTTAPSDSFTIFNGFNVRTDFWAVEGASGDPAGAGGNGANLFDVTNTRGFGLRDLDDSNNPGGPNYITFDALTIDAENVGFNVDFSFDLTNDVSTGDTNSSDELRVIFDFSYDGVTFNADETYTITGNGSGALTDGTSTAVENSFTSFSFETTGVTTAGDLGIRIQAISFTGGGDRVTFDNVVVAVPEPSTYGLLAGMGALGFIIYRRRR